MDSGVSKKEKMSRQEFRIDKKEGITYGACLLAGQTTAGSPLPMQDSSCIFLTGPGQQANQWKQG
jgi:hypothetical protein